MTDQGPWPLWTDEHPSEPTVPLSLPGTVSGPSCPACGAPASASASYCETCGAPLTPTADPPAGPRQVPVTEASAQTKRLGTHASAATVCGFCGGSVDTDGYCQTCGAKAPTLREHFEAVPAAWVGGVCDRGISHHRNEDGMALWADAGGLPRAVLVVCDGVSSSTDSDVASLVAAERARDVLAVTRPQGLGVTASQDAAMTAAIVSAVAQANDAVVAHTAPESTNAASATIALAVVEGGTIHVANVGDSRVYWFDDERSLLLTVDDSVAQEFIAAGLSRAEAEALPQAHAITRWLGRDSDDAVPRTQAWRPGTRGWLLVCSDGLWNYASEPADLAVQLRAALVGGDEPVVVARRLVAWANAQGGRDNITVALARCEASLDGAAAVVASPLITS